MSFRSDSERDSGHRGEGHERDQRERRGQSVRDDQAARSEEDRGSYGGSHGTTRAAWDGEYRDSGREMERGDNAGRHGSRRDDGSHHDRVTHRRSVGHFTFGGDSQLGASPFGTSWSGAPLGDASLGSSMGGTLGGGYRGSFGDSNFRGHINTPDHRGKGPKGYKRSDDRIKEEVSEELTNHSDVDGSDIEVEVQDGEVTLSGCVSSRHQKRAAEDCLANVRGVVDVHNRLRVGSSSERDNSASGEQTIPRSGSARSAPSSAQPKSTSSSSSTASNPSRSHS